MSAKPEIMKREEDSVPGWLGWSSSIAGTDTTAARSPLNTLDKPATGARESHHWKPPQRTAPRKSKADDDKFVVTVLAVLFLGFLVILAVCALTGASSG